MRRLVLFDVDGTLIKRGDPDHLGAMDHGVHMVFPEATTASVIQVDYDGKVDRAIASEIIATAGISISADDARLDRVFDLAGEYYRQKWAGHHDGREDLLPGVVEVVSELASRSDEFALGVLTGGSREIVAVKLDRLGLASYFPIGSYGNEVPDRPSLVPLALARAHEHYGEDFGPERSIILGDTPHDVHCSHVHGLPCLAVASGKYTEEELISAGADAVIPTLSGTRHVIELITSMTASGR